MKDLKTYIVEAIKPPRLSAKNRDLWKNGILDEEEVMKWFKENCDVYGKFEIVDGKINVKGNVEFNTDIKELPYPFREVTGYFDCEGCKKLKSLKNSPQKVGGYFDCSKCKSLTSLEGAPEKVGRFFSCSYCNNLTSLKGAPKEVGDDFNCRDCGKEFTEEEVAKICAVGGDIFI